MSTRENSRWDPLIDEIKWVMEIRHTLDEEVEEDDGVTVTIFNVPKPLQQSKPDAFSPQFIAIGPYHHWRPELYDVEKYKLSAAKRVVKQQPHVKFQDLVDGILKHERLIRDNYHKSIDFKGETLGWMMAVDACFLIQFLQAYSPVAGANKTMFRRVSSRMLHLVDSSGKKSGHNAILRDIMMLENQIPLFLLRKILHWQYPASTSQGDDDLGRILTGFIQEISPLKLMEDFPQIDASQYAHLLDLLYHVLMPKTDTTPEVDEIEEESVEVVVETAEGGDNGGNGQVKQLCSNVWVIASGLGVVKKAIFSRPVMFLVKLPWNLISVIPGISVLKQPVEYLISQFTDNGTNAEDQSSRNEDKPPRVEEITIPSVEELNDSGVKFRPTIGDLSTIAFDYKTATFYLPILSLDINSEVILRNLVAYETSMASGPLVFTRYTELINGIIDTEEDVKLLRKNGIVLNRLKSDKDAAVLWNGMSRSVRLTRVGFVDKVIGDVNRYHNSRWRVKTQKFMKKYIFGSWPFLTFLATVLLLLLTAVQAFCSVYSCSRWLNLPTETFQQP